MKQLFTILISLWGMAAMAQNYTVDNKASLLNWTGHAQTGVYSPKGTLQIKSGTISLSNGKVTSGNIIIDMTSLKQDNADMQEHLRGKDFFDVVKYPDASLTLTKITGNIATGRLTIKGVSQPANFNYTVNQRDGKTVIQASASIDRTQYGIKYNSDSYFQDLGSYAIRNTFEIEVMLQLN